MWVLGSLFHLPLDAPAPLNLHTTLYLALHPVYSSLDSLQTSRNAGTLPEGLTPLIDREAGYKVEQEDVEKHLFVPDDYFQGSVEDFWKRLPELDANFEQRRQLLAEEGKRWRFVATIEPSRL